MKRYEWLTKEARKTVSKCSSVKQLILKQKLYQHLSFIFIRNFHSKERSFRSGIYWKWSCLVPDIHAERGVGVLVCADPLLVKTNTIPLTSSGAMLICTSWEPGPGSALQASADLARARICLWFAFRVTYSSDFLFLEAVVICSSSLKSNLATPEAVDFHCSIEETCTASFMTQLTWEAKGAAAHPICWIMARGLRLLLQSPVCA